MAIIRVNSFFSLADDDIYIYIYSTGSFNINVTDAEASKNK